jgi:predicted RNase H-like nuclease (RuvC/YqgF family)
MMLKDLTVEQIVAGVIGIATGGPAFWLYISRIISKSAAETTSKTVFEQSSEFIVSLTNEVTRLNRGNDELRESLNLYRIENAELRKEISNLHEIISTLTEQLNALSRSN